MGKVLDPVLSACFWQNTLGVLDLKMSRKMGSWHHEEFWCNLGIFGLKSRVKSTVFLVIEKIRV